MILMAIIPKILDSLIIPKERAHLLPDAVVCKPCLRLHIRRNFEGRYKTQGCDNCFGDVIDPLPWCELGISEDD